MAAQLSPAVLLSQLRYYAASPPALLDEDLGLRSQLRLAARDAMLAFETPPEAVGRLVVSQPIEMATLHIACDIGLLATLAADPGQTLDHLSKTLSAEPSLIMRTMHACVGFGIVNETGSDGYALAPAYAPFASRDFCTSITQAADYLQNVYRVLPAFLESKNYRLPNDKADTPERWTHDPSAKPQSEAAPDPAASVGTLIAFLGSDHSQRIQTVYPLEARLVRGFQGGTFLVDIGAGHAQRSLALRRDMPHLPGRIVAQDLPAVIAHATPDAGVELQGYDFFTAQPVMGARAYYLRTVLHDFVDSDCALILARVKGAMEPGYSRLVLHEQVKPERGQSAWIVSSDLTMMAVTAGWERSEAQWRRLLVDAGFGDVTFFYSEDASAEAAIEAVVPAA